MIINMKVLFKNEKCTISSFSYIFKFNHVSLRVKSTTIFRRTEPKRSPYTKPIKSIEVSILILVCLIYKFIYVKLLLVCFHLYFKCFIEIKVNKQITDLCEQWQL